MGSIGEFPGLPRGLAEEIVLCRCDCGALLKVMSLAAGSRILCPSCGRESTKPAGGTKTEHFAGALMVVLMRAKVFTARANAPSNSVCDHCLTPTPKEDGYVASRELVLLADLGDLLRQRPRQRPRLPGEVTEDGVRFFRKLVAADPTPWLLCEGCTWVLFPSALARILSVKGNAELWDTRELAPSVADFLPDYSSGLPGEIAASGEQ